MNLRFGPSVNNAKLLREMARELLTQDNLASHAPIFMVQRHKRTYGFDPSYTDNPVYVTSDDYNEVSLEERKEEYAAAMVDEDTDENKKLLLVDIDTYDEWLKLYYRPKPDDTDELRRKMYDVFVERLKVEHFKNWCDENESYTKTAYQDTWENVQPFFTRKGAEEYLHANKHNLTDKEPPRVYVVSAYRNAEWQAIRQMLIDLNMTNVLLDEIKAAEAAKT